MHRLNGIAASPGVAIGRAFVYALPPLEISDARLPASALDAQLESLRLGLARAASGLSELAERVRVERGADLAGVFEGHLEILGDEEFIAPIEALIRGSHLSALAAIRQAVEMQRQEFLALEDDYLRARADDLADIGRRLSYATAGVNFSSLADLPAGALLVARDLAPSDTAQLDPARIAGFVVECGGRTSHTAIMARTLELPAVVGCAGLLETVRDGDWLAMEGRDGSVVVAPDEQTLTDFKVLREAFLDERAAMLELAKLPAVTLDGQGVMLAVNIGTPADAEAALPWNPDGVGLYRSEFLFMDRPGLPDEDEQYKAYSRVAALMQGKPVILRTLDVGGDKPIAAVPFPPEENPFLGWRGVRMCLYREEGNQDILRQQLRAALRAAANGDIWVMYPMISNVEEVEAVLALRDEVRAGLVAAGIRHGAIKTGIMIETPGAALLADKLAGMVDFFSIGSNDLTQYTLAADRGNERIARCYQTFHPAVWRLIAMVIEAGKQHGIPVGMCGELAGIEEAALPLLGLGLDEFSMSAQSLPRIKRLIRRCRMDEARALAHRVLDARTAQEALALASDAMHAVMQR
ncbi:phosphoenolpyruvate--protein phosphotransferase [Paludibacterium yongneupense]|uniref:phosphoenolpyruvate--protein phosphotransferase n=1 Tax=Paludibacterium yongneupense TaxID=400061 RepID=UPI000421362C|nr:phosphoenolpyruvate--protein phosphotransferase [Paludibacterium yongneupense]